MKIRAMFHKLYPKKGLLFSEGCYEYSLGMMDSFRIGEKYAHDMIGNFNNYCDGFIDWNLLLNEKGGPNHVGNFCDAPIMADTSSDELYIHDSLERMENGKADTQTILKDTILL